MTSVYVGSEEELAFQLWASVQPHDEDSPEYEVWVGDLPLNEN